MKSKPMGSKFLNKLWQELEKDSHRQRLSDIRTKEYDFLPNSERTAVNNRKKMVKLDERYTEIERENHILLSKLKQIISKKSPCCQEEAFKDSNFMKRKKELKELTKVNRKFLGVLNNSKSCYSFKEMDKDRKEEEKMIKNICEFEAPLIESNKRNGN